jgi:hypothetical protein
MDLFSSIKKQITSSFKRTTQKRKRKNIKTRTLTPYNNLYPIEEAENEETEKKTTSTPKSHASHEKKKTSSPKNSSPKNTSPKNTSPKNTSPKNTSPKDKSPTPESILIKVKSKTPEKAVEEIELKFPEPLPDKITYDKKIAKRMNKLFDKRDKLKTFGGHRFFETLFYLYLFKKYKTTCTITERGRDTPDIIIHVYNDERDALNDLLRKNFIEQMVKCIKKDNPFIIIPLTLEIESEQELDTHANLLIYRNNTRELEHFEPHGFEYMGPNHAKVNRVVNKFLSLSVDGINAQLNKGGLPDIKLIKASDICPSSRNGVQVIEENSTLPRSVIEPEGYCAAWSMFFAEMCLKNPEIPSRQINDAILNENRLHNENYLRRVIRGYTCLINNKMAKYFSEIFDEEITSEKLMNYIQQENNKKTKTDQYTNFTNNLSAIMQKELNPASRLKSVTARKYSKFNKTIKSDTSSSELSEGEKEKRKNKTAKKARSPKPKSERQSKPEKEAEKLRKATEKAAEKATEKEAKRQQKETAKEAKRQQKEAEKSRKATEKLASKTEKSRAKSVSKAKTLKMKSTARSETQEV